MARRPTRFRAVLFWSICGVVATVVIAAAVAVALVIERRAASDVEASVGEAQDLIDAILNTRAAQLRREMQIVAAEPRLKAVMATEDVDHETVLGVATELSQAIEADLFVITDPEMRVLADVGDPEAEGESMAREPLLKEASDKRDAVGVLSDDKSTYLVAARRLSFGATTAGFAVAGYIIDKKLADALTTATRTAVTIIRQGTIIASTLPEHPDIARALGGGADGASGTYAPRRFQAVIAGATYSARRFSPSPIAANAGLRIVVTRSLEEALAPSRQLTRFLLAILVFGVILAAIFARLLASRISQPLEVIVRDFALIGGGNLDVRAEPTGPTEVQELARGMNDMAVALAASRQTLVTKERLEQELDIARRIQTSLLPRTPQLAGAQLAAIMVPATEVGGDYYDVIATPDGGWIAVGDVAGHGLTSGLVMLMIQCVVESLARNDARTAADVVNGVNRVIYENVRARLGQDEHATFCVIRYTTDGTLRYAGAHEEMIVVHKDGAVERLANPGTWVGVARDISKATTISTHQLQKGDTLVIYTDGLIEAMNAAKEQVSLERIEQLVVDNRTRPPAEIRDLLVDTAKKWAAVQADDISVLVLRYDGV